MTAELATEFVGRDSDAASDSSGVSGASSSRAAALEATRLENLRALGLALTAEEAAGHYRRAARRARQALVERGGPALDRGGPARLRHPRALWNGDRPGLCRLTRPPNRDAAAGRGQEAPRVGGRTVVQVRSDPRTTSRA